MKEIVPSPPPIVRNQFETIRELFSKNVVPSYGRFDLAFTHGASSHVFDVAGKRYLDLGGGIAVTSLGHSHPAITKTLIEQSKKLLHVSNLYYHEPQGRLAEAIVKLIAPGKVFFCNSGAEANEGLFKLARKFGHDEGRFEILTATNSFHGRTLAGISATGQEKVKKGFEPMTPGFRHVPYNDLQAMREAISPATVAILIEGVQTQADTQLKTAVVDTAGSVKRGPQVIAKRPLKIGLRTVVDVLSSCQRLLKPVEFGRPPSLDDPLKEAPNRLVLLSWRKLRGKESVSE